MVTVDTSADISGSSNKTSVDSRPTVDRHVGRMSVESRLSIDRYIDRCIGRCIGRGTLKDTWSQKSSPRKLFFQLVLLFVSSSSPFPYFSSLKSGLVVPKEADMKSTNAWVSTLAFCYSYFSNRLCRLLCTEPNRVMENTFEKDSV